MWKIIYKQALVYFALVFVLFIYQFFSYSSAVAILNWVILLLPLEVLAFAIGLYKARKQNKAAQITATAAPIFTKAGVAGSVAVLAVGWAPFVLMNFAPTFITPIIFFDALLALVAIGAAGISTLGVIIYFVVRALRQ